MNYLIDTNIIIYHLNGNQNATDFVIANYKNITVSFISYIEVLSYPYTLDEFNEIKKFMDSFYRIDINNQIILQTIDLRKVSKIKIPDCIIGATALINKQTLVIRNVKDYKNFGIKLLNIF